MTAPGQAAVAAMMTEAKLQETVRQLCVNLGLYHYHPHDSRHSAGGWPDSVIAGPRGILFRELKRQDKSPTAEQARVGALLTAAGADYAVWRPLDLLDGTIAREVAAITSLPVRRRQDGPALPDTAGWHAGLQLPATRG